MRIRIITPELDAVGKVLEIPSDGVPRKGDEFWFDEGLHLVKVVRWSSRPSVQGEFHHHVVRATVYLGEAQPTKLDRLRRIIAENGYDESGLARLAAEERDEWVQLGGDPEDLIRR